MAWNIELPKGEWFDPDSPGLAELVEDVRREVEVAIDTETSGLDRVKDRAYYWSISWGERRICMPASTLPFFEEIFADPDRVWIFANAKFDMHMLANVGITFAGHCADVAVMHGLLYEEQSHRLKDMTAQCLGWTWKSFEDTFGKITKAKRKVDRKTKEVTWTAAVTSLDLLMKMEREDKQALVEYAANDAYGTMKLYEKLTHELSEARTSTLYPDDYPTLFDYFWKLSVPFTKVLYDCERNRCLVDLKKLHGLLEPMQEKLNDLQRRAWQLVGRPINIGSNDELVEYLYTELGLKPTKFTAGGKAGKKRPALDKEVLADLEFDNPLIPIVIEYRDLQKTLSTYVKGIDAQLDHNGRVGYKFNQDIARTGRLSSSEINIQNIKKPDKDKFHMRECFIAPPGYRLIVIDYNALEMRLMAAAAMERDMINIFREGKDIHMGNSVLVFGAMLEKKFNRPVTYDSFVWAKKIDGLVKTRDDSPEKLKPEDKAKLDVLAEIDFSFAKELMWARGAVKAISFGLNYGMKEKNLAGRLGCEIEEALLLMKTYLGRYPAVSAFYIEAINEVRQCGYAFTVLGRRRFLPAIYSHNKMDAFQAERQASNVPIQGSAADVVACAMIKIWRLGLDKLYKCKMLFQVHDELVFECPEEHVDTVIPLLREAMEHPFKTDLEVALEVSIGTGHNWAAAK